MLKHENSEFMHANNVLKQLATTLNTTQNHFQMHSNHPEPTRNHSPVILHNTMLAFHRNQTGTRKGSYICANKYTLVNNL